MNIDTAINLDDVRLLAKRRLPKIAFDFADGGVDDEVAMARNRAAFQRYRLLPRYMIDVSSRDASVTLFGRKYNKPFGISPMGITGFFRPGADLMLAEAAAKASVPYIMSSASCDSIEKASRVGPGTTWFQIYGAKDLNITTDLVRRASDLDVPVLVVTVDVPVTSRRERNMRNGFTRPMKLTPSVIMQGLRCPEWTLGYLRNGGVPMMENWQPYAARGADANAVADLYGSQTPAPGQTWTVIETVRKLWKGPLVVKGVLHPADALRCADIGVQGLLISNHGGRQLDAAPSALEVLPLIRQAVGDRVEIILDGGFRRGSDIVIALCLGAKAAFFGRPAIFGAAAGGVRGGAKVLDILSKEVDVVMGQMGCPNVSSLGPERLFDSMAACPIPGYGETTIPPHQVGLHEVSGHGDRVNGNAEKSG